MSAHALASMSIDEVLARGAAHGIGGYDKDGRFCMIAESDTRRGARQQYTRHAAARRKHNVRVHWYAIRDGTALELEPYRPERRR